MYRFRILAPITSAAIRRRVRGPLRITVLHNYVVDSYT